MMAKKVHLSEKFREDLQDWSGEGPIKVAVPEAGKPNPLWPEPQSGKFAGALVTLPDGRSLILKHRGGDGSWEDDEGNIYKLSVAS